MSRSSGPLQAHRASSDEEDIEASSPSASSSSQSHEIDAESVSEPAYRNDEEDEDDDDSQPEQQSAIHKDLQNISFGALAQAQAELSSNNARNSNTYSSQNRNNVTDAEKINSLRDRLDELRKLKGNSTHKPKSEKGTKSGSADHLARSSKHAPAEQSSRHAVTRKRSIVDAAKEPFRSRDPRFSAALSSTQSNIEASRRNYDFLKSYRDSELKDLKDAVTGIKAKKNKRKSKALTLDEENQVQQLKRTINSVENKIKAETEKERLKEVAKRHKKDERELIKQGKKPFYLKRSELKERALKEKFEGMKAKDRDKAVERRRKKLSHRERKAMPNQRRSLNE